MGFISQNVKLGQHFGGEIGHMYPDILRAVKCKQFKSH